MADQRIPPDHRLPLPEEQRGETLARSAAQGADPDQRDLGANFARANDDRDLGRTFADANMADAAALGHAFADPNAQDDRRLGKSFEERVAGKKHKKPPVTERIHKPENRRTLWIFIVCVVVLFLLIFLLGWLPHHHRDQQAKADAKKQRESEPVVETAQVKREQTGGGLVVPGTTTPETEAYVYARANGYLKTRLVDIGDHVRKGQLLAIIDAPDLDQQVDQARQQVHQAEAQLEQQRSQLALATVTVERYRVLVGRGVFSRQEGDQREADFRAQQANVAAAERNVEAYKANLRRVIALQSYEQVRAPFDGVVTQRNVDVGALISASGASSSAISGPVPSGQMSTAGGSSQSAQSNNGGSSGSPNTAATSQQSPGQGGPLFGIADTRKLRILVSVPEGYASVIRPGVRAQISFQEYPQQQFFGEVKRDAASVDLNTRTLLTEVEMDNPNGKLLPGMYAVATFPPVVGTAPLVIPGDAVAVRHDQTVIGTVVDGKVRIVPVTLGRDFGPSIEIMSGLREGDLIITNMTDEVREGVKVKTKNDANQGASQNQKPEQSQPVGGNTQYGNQGITEQNLQGKSTQQNQKGSGGQKSSGNSSSGSSKGSESKP